MSNCSNGWNINDLANLILGAGHGSPSQQNGKKDPQASLTPAPTPEGNYIPVLVLVNPPLDPIEAVSHYADYWSNRGESVAVFWVGDSGIKVGLFDCSRRNTWARQIVDVLQDGHFESLPDLVAQSVQRLVCAIITHPDWPNSPFVQCAALACVANEPSAQQLIHSYEILKVLANSDKACALSCFITNAISAEEANQAGARLQNMGDQFLYRPIKMEGFSLKQKWSTPSNLAAETFVAENGEGNTMLLRNILLNCMNPVHTCTAPSLPDAANQDSSEDVFQDSAPEHHSVLPTVKLLRTDQPVINPQQFDRLIGEMIHDILEDAIESWQIYTSPESGCCFRWVRRKNGARSIMITSIACPYGVFERAVAWLYPARGDDEIVVLARTVTTDHRKAAQAIGPITRLFEVAHMPPDHEPALVLKEVTTAVA